MNTVVETTRMGYIGVISGTFLDNGKEAGNCYSILGYIYIYTFGLQTAVIICYPKRNYMGGSG